MSEHLEILYTTLMCMMSNLLHYHDLMMSKVIYYFERVS